MRPPAATPSQPVCWGGSYLGSGAEMQEKNMGGVGCGVSRMPWDLEQTLRSVKISVGAEGAKRGMGRSRLPAECWAESLNGSVCR